MLNAQEYIEENYPDRSVKKIDIYNQNLTGELNLSNYPQLEILRYSHNQLTNLNLTNNPELKYLICYNNYLTNLDLTHCPNLKVINCSNNQLTELNISPNNSLEILYCYSNQLTNFNLGQSPNLTELYLYNNKLTNTNFLTNLPHPQKLTKLEIGLNPYSSPNLNFVVPLVNCETLDVEKSNLTGPLAPLQSCSKLSKLDIRDNNNLSADLENLPINLETIVAYGIPQIEQKLKDFENGLGGYNYQPWRKNNLLLLLSKNKLSEEEKQIKELDLSNQNLNGQLDFSEFNNLEILNISNNSLSGSLQFCQNLTKTKLKKLDISNTNLDLGLEYLPNTLEKLICQNTPLKKELKKHKNFYENKVDNITLLKRWKKANLPKLLKQELEQKLKFLQEETERLENLKQTLKEQIPFLEKQIELSEFLIKEKREVISGTASLFFTKEEALSLQELIEIHKVYSEAKKDRQSSRKNFNKYCQIRSKLENKLGEEFMETVEIILTNFEELYQKERELEKQIFDKEQAVESQSIINSQQKIINKLEDRVKELQAQNNAIKSLELIEEWQKNSIQGSSPLRIELSLSPSSISQLPNNIITSLLTKLDNEQINNEIKELLTKKQSFITNRQVTINNLRDYINKLETLINTGKIKKAERGTKFLNIFAEALSGVTLGISKGIIEVSNFGIELAKDKSLERTINNFKYSFIKEEEFIKDLAEIISSTIRKHNLESDLELFDNEYQIYDVATGIWKEKSYLTLDEMKNVIESLTTNLKYLEKETKSEQKEFDKMMSKNEFITQTEQPSKYKY